MGLSERSDASVALRVVFLWKVPRPWHPTCWWWWWPAIALSQTTAVFQSLKYGGALDVHSMQSGGDDQCMQCLWSSDVLSCGCAACKIGEGHSQPCDQTCTEDSRSSSSPTWYWRAGILQEAAQSLADDAQKCDCLGRHCSYGLSGTKDCSNEAAQSRCQACSECGRMGQLELFFSLPRCSARGPGLLIWLLLFLQMQAPTSSLRDTEDWWKLT